MKVCRAVFISPGKVIDWRGFPGTIGLESAPILGICHILQVKYDSARCFGALRV
jgi:hypothetical protein